MLAASPLQAHAAEEKSSSHQNSRLSRSTQPATSRHSAPPKTTPLPHSRTPASAPSAEAVIVTGTHASNRKARDSTSPIDVISAAALRRSGQMNLANALVTTNASISVAAQGQDTAALTAAIRMRGLSPNQVLVLVDGKRRHTTANITSHVGPQEGVTPVDLNMIPANAIDRIEVLRDGAAAMYGSDAIAGVVNIITKKSSHGLNLSGQSGANAYNGSGWQYQLGADGGFAFGDDGYVHVSGQVYHTDHFVAKTTDIRTGRFDSNYTSTPEETRENLAVNFGKTLTEGITGYGLITYAHRHAEAFEASRVASVLPDVYPNGFEPIETIEENDYAATLGLKGDHFLGMRWDLSTTYGADEDDIGNKSTGNTNFYKTYGWTPTNVRAETYRLAQWTNNLDFSKPFTIGSRHLDLSFGAEHRLEMYNIKAGEPASYFLGGTQGYSGLMPQNAGNWDRDVWAGYVDLDTHPVKHLDLDFAGRFEHYTDSGDTENGKVSARYDVTSRFALRATISNGFRAPTLPEEHFSSLSVSPTGASGVLSPNSLAARQLGAVPLKPERSTSISGGFVVEPYPNLHVTADAYQINIRDRIIPGGSYNGPDAINAIETMGASLPSGITNANAVTATYFSNGASTRTQGVDINANYLMHLHQYGTLSLTMGINLNRTTLHHLANDLNGKPLLNAQGISYLTGMSPRSKIILDAYWTLDRWDVNIRQTRYGSTKSMLTYQAQAPEALAYSITQFDQFVNTPRWLTDLEIGYRFSSVWHLAVGANNIFNIRPRRVPYVANYLGSTIYDVNSSGVPITGGYYYARVNATF
ncbi:TonB-dependent receptor plug domain-containing protein [Gluconacetobacter sacchari]|uniref:TonB-dependent receptor plug domain-containing protein n=1 Tax=Gluconacetobacter sacchari TaxID=92759 RepID=UPI0039B5F0C3